MIKDIMQDEHYNKMVITQLKETLRYLYEKNEEFGITANIKGVLFSPKLPQTIFDQLSPFTLFMLSNYTYSTLQFKKNSLAFEAGFGKENFGCVVHVPYEAIFQIIVGESILFINSVATIKEFSDRFEQEKRSLNAFKNNPNNKKFMKD